MKTYCDTVNKLRPYMEKRKVDIGYLGFEYLMLTVISIKRPFGFVRDRQDGMNVKTESSESTCQVPKSFVPCRIQEQVSWINAC